MKRLNLIVQVNNVLQFIKFGLVGLSNTVISYLIYSVCIYWGLHYAIANILAFIVSVLNSFLLNNRFVFKEDQCKRVWWKTLLKTYISYAFTGLLLSNALSYVWIDVLGISPYLAPVLNLAINTPINFIINKLWAFKAK